VEIRIQMSQGNDWPVRLWSGLLVAAFMAGAASLGGSACDWLERVRGPVVAYGPAVAVHDRQGSDAVAPVAGRPPLSARSPL
jgi:hypothetical protein